MKSLIITVLMFLTLSVGTKAQENQKVFTAERADDSRIIQQ